jgi:thiol-disulfide isomerase/thioredoxin
MAKLKERFENWKTTRSIWQKAGDVFFWVLLVMLILPGPRKVVSTTLNRVILNVKTPGVYDESRQVQLGAADYQWVLRNRDGQEVYFDDVRGSVVFLNFWATWCPPCVAELPEIKRAYEKHKNKVVFMLVSGEEREKVEAFLEKRGYDIPVYYPATEVPEVFDVEYIATTFIISPDGRIVSKKKGAVNWDSRATAKIFRDLIMQSSGNWSPPGSG